MLPRRSTFLLDSALDYFNFDIENWSGREEQCAAWRILPEQYPGDPHLRQTRHFARKMQTKSSSADKPGRVEKFVFVPCILVRDLPFFCCSRFQQFKRTYNMQFGKPNNTAIAPLCLLISTVITLFDDDLAAACLLLQPDTAHCQSQLKAVQTPLSEKSLHLGHRQIPNGLQTTLRLTVPSFRARKPQGLSQAQLPRNHIPILHLSSQAQNQLAQNSVWLVRSNSRMPPLLFCIAFRRSCQPFHVGASPIQKRQKGRAFCEAIIADIPICD